MEEYKVVNRPTEKYPWQIDNERETKFFKFYTQEFAEFYCKFLNKGGEKDGRVQEV